MDPKCSFQWLACRYSRPMKRNYFFCPWDIACIMSQELGYSVTEFLDLHGWSLHQDKNANPKLCYHQFSSSVTHSKLDFSKKEVLTRHFHGMIACLWGIRKDAYLQFPSLCNPRLLKHFMSCFYISQTRN